MVVAGEPGRGMMARKYFGTDGIRGRANGVITADLALRVGQSAGVVFRRGDHRHRVVIGKDTSGPYIPNSPLSHQPYFLVGTRYEERRS